jgi:hypothetical protein
MTVILGPIAFEHPADIFDAAHASAGQVRFLEVPESRFFMIEGRGSPGGDTFRDAIATLYPVAYTLHFLLKRRDMAAPIGPLAGLYWVHPNQPIGADDYATNAAAQERWSWRLQLPVPAEATEGDLAATLAEVGVKKVPPAIDLLRIEPFAEGEAAQILHVGAYDAEVPTIRHLQTAIVEAGFAMRGCHHELYLSDPNRTAPERMKTVLRQPITRG